MSKGLIGKKLGMTSIFTPEGEYIPVTVIEAGPCTVTQVKSRNRDGYDALQVAFGKKSSRRSNNPQKGHLVKSRVKAPALLREVPVENPDSYKPGMVLPFNIFKVGERVNISGVTKGRGFAGVIKRHGFQRGRMTHGGHSIRIPGSIGCSAWPARVIKGKKMPGHYGNDSITVKNLQIVDIRPDENLIMVKGAVPGPRSGYIQITKQKFAKDK